MPRDTQDDFGVTTLLSVIPVRGDEPLPSVGKAKWLSAARGLVREAGYRVSWKGGHHGLEKGSAVGRKAKWVFVVAVV